MVEGVRLRFAAGFVLGLSCAALLATLLPRAVLASSDRAPDGLPEAAADCMVCHEHPSVNAIFHGPHAVAADPRSGFAALGCAGCHGPSEAHMQRPPRGQPRALPDIVFGIDAATTVSTQNAACLDCHRGDAGIHWHGSSHAFEGLSCASCHRAHQHPDPTLAAVTQNAICYDCHRQVLAQTLRPSTHPLHDGQMACSDCHSVHGSIAPSLLLGSGPNDHCYRCHADLRGPFLWEHPPVAENCLNCHAPHGAVHAPLLVQRGPWLCQSCHLAQFHPSVALSGTGLPGPTLPSGSSSLLAQNCMNCHVSVHGSNHPSGAGFVR